MGLLPSGKFVARIGDTSGSALYFVTRAGAVQGFKNLPGKVLTAMTTVGEDVVVVGYSGSASTRNSYVARVGSDGVVKWQTSIDASSIGLADVPSDLAIAPDGSVFISGGVIPASAPSYGFCFSLNGASGALRFRTARATLGWGSLIEYTNNGKVHVVCYNGHWRLSTTGTTEQILSQPEGFNQIKSVSKGTDIYVVGFKYSVTPDRMIPYLQKRNNLGALLWERTNPLATGDSSVDYVNEYNQLVMDGAGYVVVGGGVARNEIQYSPILRYSPAGDLAGLYLTSSATTNFVGGPLCVDPYNQVYTGQAFSSSNGPAAASLYVYKYNTPPTTRVWSAGLRDVMGADAGRVRSMALHGPSGDLITLHSTNGIPSTAVWQVWRQQALPVSESYNVATNGSFNSPFSVLANDRFKEGAVLELVSSTTKGMLNLNTTTGSFTYLKNPGASGTDKFVYRLRKNGLVGVATTVNLNLL